MLELIRVIEARDREGENPKDLVPQLEKFVAYFQVNGTCKECNGGVLLTTQPTKDLEPGSDEYHRTNKVSLMLASAYKLQNFGILDF